MRGALLTVLLLTAVSRAEDGQPTSEPDGRVIEEDRTEAIADLRKKLEGEGTLSVNFVDLSKILARSRSDEKLTISLAENECVLESDFNGTRLGKRIAQYAFNHRCHPTRSLRGVRGNTPV